MMQQINLKYWTFILLCSLGFHGCSETTEPDPGPQTITLFSTTFESPADDAGWEAQGSDSLFVDSSKTEGRQCLSVFGTDVVPHAEKVLDSLSEESEVILRFDARCLERVGGSVSLIARTPTGPYPGVWFNIMDSVWNSYTDTTRFPPGINLRIQIRGNMISATPILVDNIEVVRIIR